MPFEDGDWVESPGGTGQVLSVSAPTATVLLWQKVAQLFPITQLEPLAEGEERPVVPGGLRDAGWCLRAESIG